MNDGDAYHISDEALYAAIACLVAGGILAIVRRKFRPTQFSYSLWLFCGSGIGLLVVSTIISIVYPRSYVCWLWG